MSDTVTQTEGGQTTTTGTPVKLKYFIDNEFRESKTDVFMDCYNPSTGKVTHLAPTCLPSEVEDCIASAKAAYPSWSNTPPNKRIQVLFKLKTLCDEHLDELTQIVAESEGKNGTKLKVMFLKLSKLLNSLLVFQS